MTGRYGALDPLEKLYKVILEHVEDDKPWPIKNPEDVHILVALQIQNFNWDALMR